jgi:DNA polymerase-3 subunit delta'
MTTLLDIFGQDAAIETLLRAWRSRRLPHGMIFAGPQGVGKATTARALATLFLCHQPKGEQPCGKCESCIVMESEGHPDYRVIYKELIRFHDKTGKSKGTSLSIHVVRPELIERAARKAVMGHGKVFVVEQADFMEAPAQSALLKTLEEPAERTLIILLTDQPHCLLPTIRSRAHTVPFAPLDVKLVAKELETRGIAKAVASDAATFSEGSLGITMQWIEDGVVDGARVLIAQIDALVSGKTAGELAGFFDAASKAYAEKQIERDELSSKDQATKEGLALYLKLAANRFRQKLAAATDPEQLERICAAIDSIVRAEGYLDSNVNVGLTLQQLTVSLHRELSAASS